MSSIGKKVRVISGIKDKWQNHLISIIQLVYLFKGKKIFENLNLILCFNQFALYFFATKARRHKNFISSSCLCPCVMHTPLSIKSRSIQGEV